MNCYLELEEMIRNCYQELDTKDEELLLGIGYKR